jgi:hypothetical protein
MAYATPDMLAVALGTRVTAENEDLLAACLEAAAEEIDASLVRTSPLPDPVPDSIVRTNVNRAVEWFKAPDTYNGGVGFDQIGVLTVPASGFSRHAAVILPYKQAFGIG